MARAKAYDRQTALEAAMQVFWDKGYHATSLKDLEAALSMKPGSIYAAFSSKENLYLQNLERYFLQGRDNTSALLDGASSPLQVLSDHMRNYVDAETSPARGRSCMIVKTIIDATAEDETIAARASAYLDEMRGVFAQGFRRAVALGELPKTVDPDRLARRYQVNIAALRIEVHRGTPQTDLEALAQDMITELMALRHPTHVN